MPRWVDSKSINRYPSFERRHTRRHREDPVSRNDKISMPMTGTFPTVSQDDEKRLRAAGYLPVLRWKRTVGPVLTGRARLTRDLLDELDRVEDAKRRARRIARKHKRRE